MSAPLSVRLESESGQTLVLVVMSLLVLVLILGLVIDIGSWKRGQRQAQAAADAAALAAVQSLGVLDEDPEDVADDYAGRNWPGVDIATTVTADEVTVLASRDMTGFVAGIIPVNVKADATARAEVPAKIANLAPIALWCENPCDADIFLSSGPFVFDEVNQESPASTFGPIRLPGVDIGFEFNTFLRCDGLAPNSSDCNPETATAQQSYDRFDRTADELRTALQDAGPGTRLVPVYNDYTPASGFHVVGWAAFTISQSDLDNLGAGTRLTLDGTFDKGLLVSGTGMSAGSEARPTNYGVRAVGLVD